MYEQRYVMIYDHHLILFYMLLLLIFLAKDREVVIRLRELCRIIFYEAPLLDLYLKMSRDLCLISSSTFLKDFAIYYKLYILF
jgi:hypothetical protein